MLSEKYDSKVCLALEELGISLDLIERKGLPFYPLACNLTLAETNRDGKNHFLVPEAKVAWNALKAAAMADKVLLDIVSAFRSIDDQSDIIREKCSRGVPMEIILTLSAPPGFSEHHTGRAIDINTPGCEPRVEPFEHTAAFAWLIAHAHRYSFTLSYPRGNDRGFIYEPWHWLFNASA